MKEVNKIAVDNNFQAIGKVKNTTELIDEIKNNNLHNVSLLKLINNDLSGLIAKVKDTKLKSSIDLNSNPISKVSNEIVSLAINTNFLGLESLRSLGKDTKILKKTTSVISEWTKDNIAKWADIVKTKPDYYF